MVEKFETSCETDDEMKFKLSIFGRITCYFLFSFIRLNPQFFMKYYIYNENTCTQTKVVMKRNSRVPVQSMQNI